MKKTIKKVSFMPFMPFMSSMPKFLGIWRRAHADDHRYRTFCANRHDDGRGHNARGTRAAGPRNAARDRGAAQRDLDRQPGPLEDGAAPPDAARGTVARGRPGRTRGWRGGRSPRRAHHPRRRDVRARNRHPFDQRAHHRSQGPGHAVPRDGRPQRQRQPAGIGHRRSLARQQEDPDQRRASCRQPAAQSRRRSHRRALSGTADRRRQRRQYRRQRGLGRRSDLPQGRRDRKT